jgi:hypothetical protein
VLAAKGINCSPFHSTIILNLFKIHESPFGTPTLTQQPTILLLRDGTDTMEGIGQIISNINAV